MIPTISRIAPVEIYNDQKQQRKYANIAREIDWLKIFLINNSILLLANYNIFYSKLQQSESSQFINGSESLAQTTHSTKEIVQRTPDISHQQKVLLALHSISVTRWPLVQTSAPSTAAE